MATKTISARTTTAVSRILDPEPVTSLREYIEAGGGTALAAVDKVEPGAVIDEIEASGLRGRGGAGFPTATKWRTVVGAAAGSGTPITVVVNAAEGEPGSFKDRALIRRNPYRPLEGALVAATIAGADEVVVATKGSFHEEIARLLAAIDELASEGWGGGVPIRLHAGPGEYLFGEETALLEVIDGRAPFPRLAPPFRQGLDDVGNELTIVNNVETMANVPGIVAHGASWFREYGTTESPGTIVCTVTGGTRHDGVGEFPMGTPLRTIVRDLGGGPGEGRQVAAVMSGVANPLVPASLLDTPATYEDMLAIGSGLGAAGFIVFDDTDDMVAVAHGVARFLAVESCGQCRPCKLDGLAIAEALDRMRQHTAEPDDLDVVRDRLTTITDGARCFLAHQQERVISSVLTLFPAHFTRHFEPGEPVPPHPILPIADLEGDRATLEDEQLRKQPDWTFDEVDSGKSPADRIDQSEGEH